MFHGLMLVVKYQYARTSQESAVFEMRHIAGVMGEGGRGYMRSEQAWISINGHDQKKCFAVQI